MKSNIKKYLVAAAGVIVLNSCSNFDKLNSNPDAAVKSTAPMLATNLILDITGEAIGSQKSFLSPFFLSKSVIYTEFPEDYQYNYLGRQSLNGLTVLTNIDKMVAYAAEGGLKNSYTALGKFIKAYKFYQITIRLGDIPYSEALKGEQNITNPKYDSQKAVLAGILSDLEEADKLFAKGSNFDGDPVYKGNVTKWRKLVNSFELQVLNSLYKKTGEADLRIVERFKEIIASKPIFEANADNFQLVYSDLANQRYPYYKLGNPTVIYPMSSSVLLDKLKDLGDYRIFYYANPSSVLISQGKSPSDYSSYIGTDPSMVYSDISKIFATKNYSQLNSRYTELANAEPVFVLSFPMVKFILAEAELRGWTTGKSADVHYADGVKAAMKFVADNTPDNPMFHHNMKMTEDYITKYIASDKVKLSGTNENKLEQIMTQRYISTFLQAPYDGFFENRRTGYPKLPINPASNSNVPGNKMPVRWLYPQNELDYNTDNVKAAIASQYGNDDVNQLMWMLK